MRKLLIAALVALSATPALAQFPPPGIYACRDAADVAVGNLTLLVAGDYAFQRPDGVSANGQVASAGTDINPLSGPLKEMGLLGRFFEEDGKTVLQFTGPGDLTVLCR